LPKQDNPYAVQKVLHLLQKKTGGKTLHESNFYDVSYKLKQTVDLLAEITKGQYIL